ncbi:MAG TPA: preprotein translocase subunit SecG [Candidatus Pelethosoma merdigallinarum]|nr:preprotein translocase subunit SecG [Candidatus Pelethosoma merdigallinarum]
MNLILIIICILLIAVVLMQSGKAESASFTGASDRLFVNRKERGGELFMTRLTFVLGAAFFIICFIMGF